MISEPCRGLSFWILLSILSIYCPYVFALYIFDQGVFLCISQVVMGNFLSDAESGTGLKWCDRCERRSWALSALSAWSAWRLCEIGPIPQLVPRTLAVGLDFGFWFCIFWWFWITLGHCTVHPRGSGHNTRGLPDAAALCGRCISHPGREASYLGLRNSMDPMILWYPVPVVHSSLYVHSEWMWMDWRSFYCVSDIIFFYMSYSQLQSKFRLMESSIREVFIFWNWAGAWKTITHSSKTITFACIPKPEKR